MGTLWCGFFFPQLSGQPKRKRLDSFTSMADKIFTHGIDFGPRFAKGVLADEDGIVPETVIARWDFGNPAMSFGSGMEDDIATAVGDHEADTKRRNVMGFSDSFHKF